ncbi:hypothetical protein [Ferruginibacter sp. SUN106]|uniref:hypothetical protein n=1 Tax=Ferruginibacter sp. SUN106 TaxID=2978348 RepID=UPI003D36BCA3
MEAVDTSSFTKTPQHYGGKNISRQCRDTLKKISLLLLLIFVLQNTIAQKLAPVKNSPLTGIALPEGSKQDKRTLSVISAQMLLEMEGKKNGVVLKNTEVLSLPPATNNGYNIDSFALAVQQAGWTLAATGDKEYYWLQQNDKNILAYFLIAKKEINIFFGESNQAPAGIIAPPQVQNDVQQNNTIAQQQTINAPQEQQVQVQNQTTENNITPAISSGYKFNTTNFDDGWTATEQADWVAVTKGSIKVLLHYPRAGTIFPADPEPLTTAAWNILVAPRYSNLKNYKTATITTFDRPYLGMGTATENATGKEVFIVFFRQGKSGWLEFISPDKNSFIQQYKFDPETIQWDSESDLLRPLANMVGYNKFAIDAADFAGKWTSDFTGIQQMYNVYTGEYAGMNMNQSNEEFVFGPGNTYNWKLLVVNGMVGSAKFNQVKSSGNFTIPGSWQIHFSKIENKDKTCHVYWSCIKGARILNLLDANYPGSGIYTQYGLAK